MKVRSVAALCLWLILPTAAAQSQQDEIIKVESNLTNLYFTVLDANNRFVTTLKQEDVRLYEDGVAQQAFTFQQQTERPLSIALVIDVSASEEKSLPEEKAAARSFVETIIRTRKDEAAIIAFTGDVFLEQPLTDNVIKINQALGRVEVALPFYPGAGEKITGIASGPGTPGPPSEGSTAIWDAVTLSAREVLARRPDQQRRRAIILLTDGQDTSSRIKRSAAIDQAIKAETVIYAIGIGDGGRYGGVDKDALRKITERTGGRAFFPKKGSDLKTTFDQIEQELRAQYLIAYSSTNKNNDGLYRQVRLEIAAPDLKEGAYKLTYRPGYFAKTSPARTSP